MIEQHKSQAVLSQQHARATAAAMRSQSGGRGNSASSFGGDENLSNEDGKLLNQVEVGKITKKSSNAHSAAGFGYRGSVNNRKSSYAMNNVNRSNSLHERKFNNHATDFIRGQQRLEPLV